MDPATLIQVIDFSRARLLGTLDAIENGGYDVAEVLAWRPGPGRAHIAWQAMHCAATHDGYLARATGGPAPDAAFKATYAFGSTPSDAGIPTLADIRRTLEASFAKYRAYVASLDAAALERQIPAGNNKDRSVGETVILLAWHEAHHQGQIHLTFNCYKAAHTAR